MVPPNSIATNFIDIVPKWLRRWTRNPSGFTRARFGAPASEHISFSIKQLVFFCNKGVGSIRIGKNVVGWSRLSLHDFCKNTLSSRCQVNKFFSGPAKFKCDQLQCAQEILEAVLAEGSEHQPQNTYFLNETACFFAIKELTAPGPNGSLRS